MYYAAFTYNANREYSAGVNLSAMALSPVDFDRDGDIDQEDFGLFQPCLSGAFMEQTDPDCQAMTLDDDTDVDGDDLTLFLGCVSGSGMPPEVNCTAL